MIKKLPLVGVEREVIFQEVGNYYRLVLDYLEDDGVYCATLSKGEVLLVRNQMRPFSNLVKDVMGVDIEYLMLYDTYIDRADKDVSMMGGQGMKEGLGKRYQLIYLVDAKVWERDLLRDMSEHPREYYKKK